MLEPFSIQDAELCDWQQFANQLQLCFIGITMSLDTDYIYRFYYPKRHE